MLIMAKSKKRRKRGITLQQRVQWKRKKKYGLSYFSYLFHISHFKIPSLTILDRMQCDRRTDGCMNGCTDRPKPIHLLNFFEVGGIKKEEKHFFCQHQKIHTNQMKNLIEVMLPHPILL